MASLTHEISMIKTPKGKALNSVYTKKANSCRRIGDTALKELSCKLNRKPFIFYLLALMLAFSALVSLECMLSCLASYGYV